MSSLLLFVMVAAIFVHTFMNFFLKIWSLVSAKVTGAAAPVEHSIEVFVSKIVATVLSWFKKL